jgi:hypothetical protein
VPDDNWGLGTPDLSEFEAISEARLQTLPSTLLQIRLQRVGALCPSVTAVLRRYCLSPATDRPTHIGVGTYAQHLHHLSGALSVTLRTVDDAGAQ